MSGFLSVESLKKHYPVRKGFIRQKEIGTVKAVDDISLTIEKGETLGLIGESGCGKSTLSQVLMGITPATGGTIRFKGEVIDAGKLKGFRKKAQMVFQDPYSSLNPRQSVRRIIEEPLRIHERLSSSEKRERVLEVLDKLSIPEDSLVKYPHEFSGGQRQRIGIARALVLRPEFVICDEPVSALDMSVQAQILNLFKDLQRDSGLTYLFISHDMSVVKHVSSRIAVMYMGRIVELCDKDKLFSDTLHPYTMALISAIPVPSPVKKARGIILSGDIPDPLNPPSGCAFRTRCSHAIKRCAEEAPALREVKEKHYAACHLCSEVK